MRGRDAASIPPMDEQGRWIVPAARKGYVEVWPGWLVRNDGAVEAERCLRRDGYTFSGWLVKSVTNPRHEYSNPIPTKAHAIRELLAFGVNPAS